MALLKIVKEGDPVLRGRCKDVDVITPRIIRLLDDMKQTLKDAEGAGLAAPQVGVLRRVCVVDADDGKYYEMINPEIIETEGVQHKLEGCLSIPDRWGITERPARVKVRAMDRSGQWYEAEGTGLLARAFCHEIDHLSGILYIDGAKHMLSDDEMERYRNGEKIEGLDDDDDE